ncbi:HAD family hydrolase [Gordonia sp. CPCC 205515]|uniref:HAD family hydrolase n=1 Tax=Gordonia sp. CPCC 205515 TaxID=3140791 RepID=UPI003AF351A9
MCPPPTAVIFDLDGTLVQTREASWQVFAPIAARHDLAVDSAEKFYHLFAGNFFASLRAVCETEDRADVVVGEFMAALDSHYAPAMVPGLIDVVRTMVPHSRLAVLSSNTTAVVRRVLRANHLEYCFAHVFGGDVEPDKAAGIARFLADAASGSGRLCRAYYDEPTVTGTLEPRPPADPGEVVLITDTVGDVEAAGRAGIRAVGVAWGMHTEEQLLAAGAEFVAIWPQELLAHLYGRAEETCTCATPAADAGPLEPAQSVSVARRQVEAARRRRERRRAAAPQIPATVVSSSAATVVDSSATRLRRPDPALAAAILRTMT